jgi:hypothetical protein
MHKKNPGSALGATPVLLKVSMGLREWQQKLCKKPKTSQSWLH